MAANLGAHEVMEIHEVLTDAIDSINQFQLYRPYIKEQELKSMLDKQLQFMTTEYNNMIQLLTQQGINQGMPYRTLKETSPVYGLDNPGQQTPNFTGREMDDRDVASGMLGRFKSAAHLKMMATLECANPNLRRMFQQAAVNCAEMAFETWNYMNHKGFYQVPTMKEMTTNTILNTYQPIPPTM